MPFLLIPKFLPVLRTGLFRQDWCPPRVPQPQGSWDSKDDINDKTHRQLTINKVDQLDRSNSSTLTHPIYTRDTPKHAPFNITWNTITAKKTKETTHSHSLHVSLNVLSCMSTWAGQKSSVSAADSGSNEIEFTAEVHSNGFSEVFVRVLYFSKAFTWLEL